MEIMTVVQKVTHWFCLAAVLPLYSIATKQYLDTKQLSLLILETLLFISTLLPSLLHHMLYLVLVGTGALVILDVALGEYFEFVDRYEEKNTNLNKTNNIPSSALVKKYRKINGKQIFCIGSLSTLKKLKFKETFIIPIFLFLWLLLKWIYSKAPYWPGDRVVTLYDGTIFVSFLQNYKGWNCNYPQFSIVPLFSLICCLFSLWILKGTLKQSSEDRSISQEQVLDLSSYKEYVLKYLVFPITIGLFCNFGFNFVAFINVDSLPGCYIYYKYGIVIKNLSQLAMPLSIRLFFFMKTGRFLLQSEGNSNNSRNSRNSRNFRAEQGELLQPLRISQNF